MDAEMNTHETDEPLSAFKPLRQALREVFDDVQWRHANGGRMSGTPTGFTALDEMTGGLQAGHLIVLAGRPGMGKTALAMNIAEHVALRAKLPIAVFSMDQPAKWLGARMMASIGRINSARLLRGKMEDEDWNRMSAAVQLLKDAKLFIDETRSLTVGQLCERARHLHGESGGLSLVVVDFFKLIRQFRTGSNRVREQKRIVRMLKGLARELNVPVLLISQLHRRIERRMDKRPKLADLCDVGVLERVADTIMFLYRDSYYHANSQDMDLAEIIVALNDDGPTGSFNLMFYGEYTRFDNLLIEFE